MSRFAISKRALKRCLQESPAAAPASSAVRARTPTHQVGVPHAARGARRKRVRARMSAASVGRESAGGDRGAARSRGDGSREGWGSRGTASRHVGAAIRASWTSGRIPSEVCSRPRRDPQEPPPRPPASCAGPGRSRTCQVRASIGRGGIPGGRGRVWMREGALRGRRCTGVGGWRWGEGKGRKGRWVSFWLILSVAGHWPSTTAVFV